MLPSMRRTSPGGLIQDGDVCSPAIAVTALKIAVTTFCHPYYAVMCFLGAGELGWVQMRSIPSEKGGADTHLTHVSWLVSFAVMFCVFLLRLLQYKGYARMLSGAKVAWPVLLDAFTGAHLPCIVFAPYSVNLLFSGVQSSDLGFVGLILPFFVAMVTLVPYTFFKSIVSLSRIPFRDLLPPWLNIYLWVPAILVCYIALVTTFVELMLSGGGSFQFFVRFLTMQILIEVLALGVVNYARIRKRYSLYSGVGTMHGVHGV